MSTFGKHYEVSLFGASHEQYIGITIHNYPCGVEIDTKLIARRLALRRGMQDLTSARHEEDDFEIISGYFQGKTTGAPLTVLVRNFNQKSQDYPDPNLIRPAHADYTYYHKYHGFHDYRGGGSASGRLTVALVVLGALCEQVLAGKGIIVASRMKSIEKISDLDPKITPELLKNWQEDSFPVFSETAKAAMLATISRTKAEKDSVGGIVETYIYNLPIGLGEPFFDSFESILAHLIFSIPGVKGLEFGRGFAISSLHGSEANDQLRYENAAVVRSSNNSGGIEGGITTGSPVIFRTAFKPTPSIGKPQKTINLRLGENSEIEIHGRHDAIIAIKGLHVVNALAWYAIMEMMSYE
ncbi:MAG: chorismate synthase [Acholeplasmataceae bacterium]|nr:chorismate synthase [Acholeplasmataceae bacterium]